MRRHKLVNTGALTVVLISLVLAHTIGQCAGVADSPNDKTPNVADIKKPNIDGNKQPVPAAVDVGAKPATAAAGNVVAAAPAKVEEPVNNAKADDTETVDNSNKRKSSSNADELPASLATGFYIIVGMGFLAAIYITFRAFRKSRIRSNRAARRYGTRGNHSRHELQPLPAAMESDSDGDDQQTVVFDRQP